MEYKIYQSNLIKSNFEDFVNTSYFYHKKFTQMFKEINNDSTWGYQLYNIFCLSSTHILWYKLYKELNYHIRSFIGDNRPIYIQAWLNFHSADEVLKKHDHDQIFHGYISIDPKDTTTVFNKFEIKNQIGQIYIGPGGKDYSHYVRIDKPYDGKRITIGFDLVLPNNKDLNNQSSTNNLGLIPLI